MQFIPTTSFGRRSISAADVAARAMAEAPLPHTARDKWAILRDLTEARAAFNISDRDLAVLSALVSFHPHASLLDGDSPVVFPSNATLSARAHGMAESTLRRHIAALTRAGLILRRDSPNGKRYARRGAGGELSVAYGFDLRPLLLRDAEIVNAAAAAREVAERRRTLRESIVLALRDAVGLLAYTPCPNAFADRIDNIRRILRRKLDMVSLTLVQKDIEALMGELETPTHMPHTPKVDGNDADSERHIQESNKELLDKKEPADNSGPIRRQPPQLTPGIVIAACPETLNYVSTPPRDWEAIHRCASTLRPMIGIAEQVWMKAQRIMGPAEAAITVLGILQRFGSIKSPNGYLTALTKKAEKGRYSPVPMIMSLGAIRDRETLCHE